jgi:hypothetical protein
MSLSLDSTSRGRCALTTAACSENGRTESLVPSTADDNFRKILKAARFHLERQAPRNIPSAIARISTHACAHYFQGEQPSRVPDMSKVYFHYSNSEGICVDERGTAVGNLTELREHAACAVLSLIAGQGPEDWREWTLHVSDDLDDEILVLPFSSMLGKLH